MPIIDNIFSDGERRSLLVDERGDLDFWSTLYVTVELRQDQKQTSIKKELYNIKLIRNWERLHGRSLLDEFRKQKFLDKETIVSIKRYCGLSAKKIANKEKKIVKFSRLANSPTTLDTVDKNYQYQRMLSINNYLKFCAWELCKFKTNAASLRNDIEIMYKNIKAHYPKGLSNVSKVTHAEAEDFQAFLKVAHPESRLNPFTNYELKLRNYLLIQVLYWTGCRPSEALALTLDDVNHDVEEPALKFVRRHDDINDPRKLQPTLKTQEREIPIPPIIYDDLEYYIRSIRPTFTLSKSHPYIFVSHKGQTAGSAMTDKAFSEAVIPKLKAVDPRFENIQRRGFRVYFNERLSERIDSYNEEIHGKIIDAENKGNSQEAALLKRKLIKEADEIDTRMQLNGHSSPHSSAPYLDRYANRKAKEIHKRMIVDISNATKEISDARKSK